MHQAQMGRHLRKVRASKSTSGLSETLIPLVLNPAGYLIGFRLLAMVRETWVQFLGEASEMYLCMLEVVIWLSNIKRGG